MMWEKLLELISGGLFFEYPPLIVLAVLCLAAVFAYWRYTYLSQYQASRGLGLWRSVIGTFLVSIVPLVLLSWIFYRYWGLPHSFADDQIGILIAEIPDQHSREQQIAYQNALRFSFQHSEDLGKIVKIRLIERPLPPDAEAQQSEAVRIGRWLHATFVLRPYVVQGIQEPWLTVVNPQAIFEPESRLGEFANSQLPDLDKLRLPSDLNQLAEITLALALARRGSYEKSDTILYKVLMSGGLPEAAGSRWEIDFLRGNVLFHLNHFDGAAAEYKKALILKSDYGDAWNNLGNALVHQGQYDAAARDYNKALMLEPDKFSVIHINLGVLFGQEGRYSAAIEEFNKVIRTTSNSALTSAEAHFDLGFVYSHSGHDDLAIGQYRTAIKLDPELSEAYNNLGLLLERREQYSVASEDFREAVKFNPRFSAAYNNLGLALKQQGEYPAAIDAFHEAMSLEPNDVGVYNNLGNTLDDEGQFATATAVFKKAIEINPKYALTYNNLGSVLSAQGDYAAAIEQFNKALTLEPDDAEVHYNLGVAFAEQGEDASAAVQFENYIAAHPEVAKAHYNLAIVLEREGKHAAATSEFDEAVRLEPRYAAAYLLGNALPEEGRNSGYFAGRLSFRSEDSAP